MFKRFSLIAAIILVFMEVSAQYAALLDDKITLHNEDFIKALVEADNIVLGRYLQGGKTKARVRVENTFIGDAKDEIIVNNLDNEKYGSDLKEMNTKKGISIFSFSKNRAVNMNFLNTAFPFLFQITSQIFHSTLHILINFWQPFDIRLFEVAATAIREKEDKMLSDKTRESFVELSQGICRKEQRQRS
jgi:hypothetical protein